jgi:RNA polymerase sigma factor (sigma-70 family)
VVAGRQVEAVDPAILDAPGRASAHAPVAVVTGAGPQFPLSASVSPAGPPAAVNLPAPVPGRAAPWAPGTGTGPGVAARDRSPDAFADLYHREHHRLVRLAFLMLGSREQAEEVVQDAFVRLHGRWAGVDNPGGYLRTSVVNGCRDARRRLARYRAREPRLAAPAETWDHPDELSDVLATLTARQRSVLVLRYYVGLNESEIAAVLDIRPGTVKSSLHRGIRRLRHELA